MNKKDATAAATVLPLEKCRHCLEWEHCLELGIFAESFSSTHSPTERWEKRATENICLSPAVNASNCLPLNLESVSRCRNLECRAKVFPLLYQMSRVIAESANLCHSLLILQQIMAREMNFVCGMITLHHQRSGSILIHESFGLTREEASKGVYALGEGITGKVVESGHAIMLPRISEEPAFLHRTRSLKYGLDQELSFICVPIKRGCKVLGTISAERIYDSDRLLELDVELLATFAAMLAPTVELHLMEQVDKVYLERENQRLNDALRAKFKPANIIGNSKAMRGQSRFCCHFPLN